MGLLHLCMLFCYVLLLLESLVVYEKSSDCK